MQQRTMETKQQRRTTWNNRKSQPVFEQIVGKDRAAATQKKMEASEIKEVKLKGLYEMEVLLDKNQVGELVGIQFHMVPTKYILSKTRIGFREEAQEIYERFKK